MRNLRGVAVFRRCSRFLMLPEFGVFVTGRNNQRALAG